MAEQQLDLKATTSKGILMSMVGLNAAATSYNVDWKKERISLRNFDRFYTDIEFMRNLCFNTLCPKCLKKNMQYCYCGIGNEKIENEKCLSLGNGEFSRINFSKSLYLESEMEDGIAMIQMNEESLWEPYLCKGGISIWRKEERENKYIYKIYSSFSDISAIDLFHVQTDLEYRKEWDNTVVKLKVIEEDPEEHTSNLIYWEMGWPRFFSNRDYVFTRRYFHDPHSNIMMICNRSTTDPRHPETKSIVRVNNYWSLMILMPFRRCDEPGVHFVLTYFDDPVVSLPERIKTAITEKQVPEFVNKMYAATKIYAEKRDLKAKMLDDLQDLEMNHIPFSANPTKTNSFWSFKNLEKK
ncbi:stAR-related lipid transfer protein 7, mitochondrial-like [Teleopsis dalmanni]|uniref:stAR-related lipid transfer protein 7, mitochondrial-like n=1 Tax=Teleopsis dalmanni TaxID=139649 RepID=UPI0018CE3270|nr:stAR-related lipid transfer protein 7, mitochondrial-like [Teleopsis dalmanni]